MNFKDSLERNDYNTLFFIVFSIHTLLFFYEKVGETREREGEGEGERERERERIERGREIGGGREGRERKIKGRTEMERLNS